MIKVSLCPWVGLIISQPYKLELGYKTLQPNPKDDSCTILAISAPKIATLQ